MAADGLITMRSSQGPTETMNRLEAALLAKGMTVFARIDHAAGAAAAGLALRPTELLIFGNAKVGTPLMQSIQTVGIDLPVKALTWQDEAGNTWLSYNDPSWFANGTDWGTRSSRRSVPCPPHLTQSREPQPPVCSGARRQQRDGRFRRQAA